jgi:cation diffusion facilitator CzcD-associated flavoprotein CzcO
MSEGRRERRIVIIGSGFSGICLGIKLKQAGIETFTIFEKSDRVGGTWRDNTYPGAACDTPAFSYCFSFEQKTDWSRKWVPQPEILGYLEHCVRKYGLEPHLRFGSEVESARFDEHESVWRIRTTAGEEVAADVVVSGVGQLNRPSVPDLPGLHDFRGPCFHSARWDHTVDLAGKQVAVVGNAASAIQFVPQIAPEAGRLRIFQRSPNWMLPRLDRAYTEKEKQRFARFPLLAKLYRWWIWLQHESRFPAFRRNAVVSRWLARIAEQNMRDQISSPELQHALVPDYPVGGKRILISDDYYATLERDDVELVTSPIDRLREDGLVTCDGRVHPADVVILATGFESTAFLAPMAIEGLGGRALTDEWKEGARAYLGMTVAGFPNFFMMYGPNTNLGHNSIIFMIECQTRYIIDCVRQLFGRRVDSIDLRADVMESYNAKLQEELSRTVWSATGKSWYKTSDGKITNNWSGTTARYWWKTRRADLRLYHQIVRAPAQEPSGEAHAASAR